MISPKLFPRIGAHKRLGLVGATVCGLGLAGCGSPAVSPPAGTLAATATPAPTAAATATAPAATPTASIDYGQQYLADVAAWNAATAQVTRSDTLSSPAVIAAANQAVVTARSLLDQTWPANAQTDVHTYAMELETINEDVKADNYSKFESDLTVLKADAQVVRAELNLPAFSG